MKTILVGVAGVVAAALIGCSSEKELQVEMVSAELIKIDTIFRQSPLPQQLLTWRDQDHIQYVSFVPITQSYNLGTVMTVLRQR